MTDDKIKKLWLTRAIRGFLLLIWMCVIFAFSHQANSFEVTETYFGSFNFIVRKASHMTEYAILLWLSLWFQSSFEDSSLISGIAKTAAPLGRLLLPCVFTVLYAVGDEWHQSFVPGRTALLTDVMVDSTGACIAAVVTLIPFPFKRTR